jgi:hypothetical protein
MKRILRVQFSRCQKEMIRLENMKTCLLPDNTCGQLQSTVRYKEIGLGTNLLVTKLFLIMSPTDAGVQGGGRRERSSRFGYSRPQRTDICCRISKLSLVFVFPHSVFT